jgi:hypothetical protein
LLVADGVVDLGVEDDTMTNKLARYSAELMVQMQ